jgi:hypothetical protein
LGWEAQNVEAVYLDGVPVADSGSREVCLTSGELYELESGYEEQVTHTYDFRIVTGAGDIEHRTEVAWVYSDVYFTADDWSLIPGECTQLRWDVEHVREVYLDNKGIVGVGYRTVCPTSTRTYTLRVVTDCDTKTRTVTIEVEPDEEPVAWIIEPTGASHDSTSQHVTLRAYASDREDDDSTLFIEWRAPGVPGLALGYGREIVAHFPALCPPARTYLVTLRVTDSAGNVTKDSIEITIPAIVC